MIDYSYDKVREIEDHVENMRDHFRTVFNIIIETEKTILSELWDSRHLRAFDADHVAAIDPYPEDYRFAAKDTTYYHHGNFEYRALTDILILDQCYEYGDGDYACSIERRIPYEILNGGPELIDSYIREQHFVQQKVHSSKIALENRLRMQAEEKEKQERFDKYLMLKAEFENV